jgi:hypothetical protein
MSSAFQPNHTVQILYPAFPDDYEYYPYVFGAVHDAANRYEPGPLVEDRSVEASNSDFESTAAASLFVMTPAKATETDRFVESFLESRAGEIYTSAEELKITMGVLTNIAGFTTLRVLTYKQTSQNDHDTATGPIHILIECWHVLKFTGGRELSNGMMFQFPLTDFEALKLPDLWFHTILDAVYRWTVLAVKHFQQRIDIESDEMGTNVIVPETEWLPPRKPAYQLTALLEDARWRDPVVTGVGGQSMECLICGETKQLVDLPCAHAFTICYDCCLSWCQARSPTTVSCPQCRKRLWKDGDGEIERLVIGTSGKAYYSQQVGNNLFNKWESTERICADLDKPLSDRMIYQIDSEVLTKAWVYLTEGALQESAASTPLHMQPVRMPAFSFLDQEMKILFRRIHGQTFGTYFLQDCLKKFANDMFCKAFQSSPAWDLLSSRQKHEVAIKRWIEPIGMPPMLLVFVARMIHRLVQFMVVRKCSCSQEAWHVHGEKPYWRSIGTQAHGEEKQISEAFESVMEATRISDDCLVEYYCSMEE